MKRHWVEFRLPTSDACPADMNALGAMQMEDTGAGMKRI